MRKFQDIVFIWTQAYTEIFRSAFSVPLKSLGRLLTASGHGFHLFDKGIQIRLIPLHKGLLLDLLIFLLYMLQSAYCSKYSAMTTNFYILNVFLRFLHQFVWKHFRIFVTVMRSKFHFLLKFSTRGTLKRILFCHVAFYLHGLICWTLIVSQLLFVFIPRETYAA